MGEGGDAWRASHRSACLVYQCQFPQPQRRIPRFVHGSKHQNRLKFLLSLSICLGGPTVLYQTPRTKIPCMLCETVGMTTPFTLSTDWSTRVKQIAKLWRKASSQDRAPYVVRIRQFSFHYLKA